MWSELGIHTANALHGYEVGLVAGDRDAFVIFGGIHTTVYPDKSKELGAANTVVQGDGDIIRDR